MALLTGKERPKTYPGLLHVTNESGDTSLGLDATLRQVTTGSGAAAPFTLSTGAMNFPSQSNLTIGGTAVQSFIDGRNDLINHLVLDTNSSMSVSDVETILSGGLSQGGNIHMRPNQSVTIGRGFSFTALNLDFDMNGGEIVLDMAQEVTAMDAAADTITVPGHGFTHPTTTSNATRVVFHSPDGYSALPGGLKPNRKYFVGVIDADTLKVATTAANAFAGTYVDLTGTLGGDVFLASQTPELFRLDSSATNTEAARFAFVSAISAVDDTPQFNSSGTYIYVSKLTFTNASELVNFEVGDKIKIASDDLESWGTTGWTNTEHCKILRKDATGVYVSRLGKTFATNVRIGKWKDLSFTLRNGTIRCIAWQSLANDSDTNLIRTTCYKRIRIENMRFINAPSSVTLHYAPEEVIERDNYYQDVYDKEMYPFEPDRVLTATWDYATDAELVTITGHNFETGDYVYFGTLDASGAFPTHASSGSYGTQMAEFRIYYIIRVDDNRVKLATSSANATAGTALQFTSNGTGTITVARYGTSMFGYAESQVGGYEGVHLGKEMYGCRHATDTRIFNGNRLDYSGASYGKVYAGVKAEGQISTLFGNHAPCHANVQVGLSGLNSPATGIGNRGVGAYIGGALYNLQRGFQSFGGNGGQRSRCVISGWTFEKCGVGQAQSDSVTQLSNVLWIGSQRGSGTSLALEAKETSEITVNNALYYISDEGESAVYVYDNARVTISNAKFMPEYWTTGGPSLFQVLTASNELPKLRFNGAVVLGTGWADPSGTSGVHSSAIYGTLFHEPSFNAKITSGAKNETPYLLYKVTIDGMEHDFVEEFAHKSGTLTMSRYIPVVNVNKTTGSATSVVLPQSLPLCAPVRITDGKGDAGSNNITVTAASLTQISYTSATYGLSLTAIPAGERVWGTTSKASGLVMKDSSGTLYLTQVKGTFQNAEPLTCTATDGVSIFAATSSSSPSSFTVNINGSASFVINANYGSVTFEFYPDSLQYIVIAKTF